MSTVPTKKTSKLNVKIQSLLELICDLKAMEECVLEMKYDTRKAPLGESDGINLAGKNVRLFILYC